MTALLLGVFFVDKHQNRIRLRHPGASAWFLQVAATTGLCGCLGVFNQARVYHTPAQADEPEAWWIFPLIQERWISVMDDHLHRLQPQQHQRQKWVSSPHEFHETCHSVTFYVMNKDSKRCCDTTAPESIHSKDEQNLLSSLVWIDQYTECNRMTSFMEFMRCISNYWRNGVGHELKCNRMTSFMEFMRRCIQNSGRMTADWDQNAAVFINQWPCFANEVENYGVLHVVSLIDPKERNP